MGDLLECRSCTNGGSEEVGGGIKITNITNKTLYLITNTNNVVYISITHKKKAVIAVFHANVPPYP